MKKRNILLVVCTIFLVILFSYQPPLTGNAQSSVVTKDSVRIEPVILRVDTTLIDTLKTYKVMSDSLKIQCKNQLNFIRQQQKVLLEQMEAVDYLTTKN